MTKKIILFLISFLMTTILVIGYFKLTQKISTISLPNIPSVSFSDLVKFSRFSLEKAPAQSLVGNITAMSGNVEYESRTATESAKISSNVQVQQGESLSTGDGGKFNLNFNGVAEIDADANSAVDIIQTLPVDSVFRQTLGSVEYKKLGNDPVSVRVGHLIVEDQGDVKISFTADSPITTITVINGSVTIAYNDINNDSQVVTAAAGKVIRFNEAYKRLTIRPI